MERTLFDARITGDQTGAGIMNTGSGIGKYMGLVTENYTLVPAPYPVLNPGDVPELGQRDDVLAGIGAAITTACKNVTEAVKWLDYGYSPEGHMLYNFGVEGLSYTMVNGYPTYTDLVMKNPDGLPLGQAMAQHFRSSFNGPFVQDKAYMEQYSALPEQKESLKVWSEPTNEKRMPPVTPTQEESSRYAAVMNDVTTRFQEMMVKVITGQEPVDNWDTVVQQLKQMGLDEAVAIQQAALDRYNSR
jgi:putative aldouronate transport system substrate-binding protein